MTALKVIAEDMVTLLAAAAVGIWTAFLTVVTCPGGPQSLCSAVPAPVFGPIWAGFFAALVLSAGAGVALLLDKDFGRVHLEAIRWLNQDIGFRGEAH